MSWLWGKIVTLKITNCTKRHIQVYFEYRVFITINDIIFLTKFFFFRPVHDAMSNPALFDRKHGIQMGVPSDGCDDAKVRKSYFFLLIS